MSKTEQRENEPQGGSPSTSTTPTSAIRPGQSGPHGLPEKFASRIRIDDCGCWLWVGSVCSGNGYGLSYKSYGTVYAHRAVYEIARGPIPDGLQIDHLCRVRRCVNPDHLEPVTQRENILRGVSPSAKWGRREVCNTCGGELLLRAHYSPPRRVCPPCRAGDSLRYEMRKARRRLLTVLAKRGAR